MLTIPLLAGGADLNGTASGDLTDLRFNHPYRACPSGLALRIKDPTVLATYIHQYTMVVGSIGVQHLSARTQSIPVAEQEA
eukprot:1212411-Pleurochrysis_carterae.AAC.3